MPIDVTDGLSLRYSGDLSTKRRNTRARIGAVGIDESNNEWIECDEEDKGSDLRSSFMGCNGGSRSDSGGSGRNGRSSCDTSTSIQVVACDSSESNKSRFFNLNHHLGANGVAEIETVESLPRSVQALLAGGALSTQGMGRIPGTSMIGGNLSGIVLVISGVSGDVGDVARRLQNTLSDIVDWLERLFKALIELKNPPYPQPPEEPPETDEPPAWLVALLESIVKKLKQEGKLPPEVVVIPEWVPNLRAATILDDPSYPTGVIKVDLQKFLIIFEKLFNYLEWIRRMCGDFPNVDDPDALDSYQVCVDAMTQALLSGAMETVLENVLIHERIHVEIGGVSYCAHAFLYLGALLRLCEKIRTEKDKVKKILLCKYYAYQQKALAPWFKRCGWPDDMPPLPPPCPYCD